MRGSSVVIELQIALIIYAPPVRRDFFNLYNLLR